MLEILQEEQEQQQQKDDRNSVTISSDQKSAPVAYKINESNSINNILLEELATDSYQNLLFSILKHKIATGVYPYHITIVTHEFKRRRFLVCTQ